MGTKLTKVVAVTGAALLALTGCASSLTTGPGGSATSDDPAVVSEAPGAPPVQTGVPSPQGLTERGGIVIGQDSAPVTVTVMSDFMCPACAQFEAVNKSQLEQFAQDGTIKMEYVPVSILDRFSQGSQYSTRSASAAYCVAESDEDKFVAFHDSLFENQPSEGTPGMTSQELATLAADAGVSSAGQDCIVEDRYADFATSVTEAASMAGMRGTPTVFVNGEEIGDWAPESLKAQIDARAGGTGSPSSTTSPSTTTAPPTPTAATP